LGGAEDTVTRLDPETIGLTRQLVAPLAMARAIWLVVRFGALFYVFPLPCEAAIVEVPELGIKFADFPDDQPRFEVDERPGGYHAQARVGKAVLNLYREEEPVPVDANLADSSYRAILDAKFHASVKSAKDGAATSLGGHAAWTVTQRTRAGPYVAYSWLTYTIVDQHLYILTVNTVSQSGTPEFDSLVKATGGIAFEAIQRAEPPKATNDLGGSSPTANPANVAPPHGEEAEPLPLAKHIKGAPVPDYYPAPAKRLSQEGRVLVAFKISSAGRAVDIRIAAAEPQVVFDGTVTALIRGLEFTVPSDWEASGRSHREYTFSFVFRLSPCLAPCEPLAPFPADYMPVTITGSRLPSSAH
jgi:TonB family protein